jgi:hypothetical protein
MVWRGGTLKGTAGPALPDGKCRPLGGDAAGGAGVAFPAARGWSYLNQPRLRKYSIGTTAESTIRPSANG